MASLEKLQEIDQHGEGLTKWEIDFIAKLIDEKRTTFSFAEQRKIQQIYEERVNAN